MKKITALILALLMAMLTVSAFAAGGSSQGGDDYNKTTVTTPTNTEPAFEFGISDDPDDIAKANEEVAKLAEAENPADYFGKADDIANILGDENCEVNELVPVYAENYKESMGPQDIQLSVPTPYTPGDDVAVMIGVETGKDADGNPIIEWKAVPGKVQEDGSIAFTLDSATILAVQENGGLLAIASKAAGEGDKAFIFAISDKEELVAWAEAERAKLAEAESAAAYFGLDNLEGEAKELQPVYAANYEESMGEQDISLAFETKYEQGADVTVALGFGNAESVAWSAVAGKGQEDGSVLFNLDPATILKVQENNALLAVINK